MPEEEITQEDIDRVADVIWWVKGFMAARESMGLACDIGPAHIETFRKIRLKFLRESQPNQVGPQEPPF